MLASLLGDLPATAGTGLYVIDRRTGRVVVEQDHPSAGTVALGSGAHQRFAAVAKAKRKAGLRTIDGHRTAFDRLPAIGGNANDWLVAAVARDRSAGPLAGVPRSAYLLVAVALLLVVLSSVMRSRAVRKLELEALTDSLTGLSNRRALIADLPKQIADAPSLLIILDLDGFKSYNDTFGHPTGDILPEEAQTTKDALRTADHRMYAHKHDGRMSPAHQSVAVLLRTVEECNPDLGEHVSDVVDLAVTVGTELEMGPGEIAVLRNAAALHDVGKLAVPHEILMKPAKLDPDELEFICRHTLIGERIVAAAPALQQVAPIVRASHERWDGAGYPDGLRGEQIPIAARIVFACDALDAMIQARPYAPARPLHEALAELRRCAGTQFDPRVVDALVAVLTRPPSRAQGNSSATATRTPQHS